MGKFFEVFFGEFVVEFFDYVFDVREKLGKMLDWVIIRNIGERNLWCFCRFLFVF